MVSLEDRTTGKRSKQGRWTEEEQRLFATAVQIYGKRWKKLEQVMGTRTSTQCRSHGQKYFLKLKHEQSKSQSAADSLTDEDFPAELEEKEDLGNEDHTYLEDMDNNQLREHLKSLIQTNNQLTKEIQRLRASHSEPICTAHFLAMLTKRPCSGLSPSFPTKTTEVKVIFSASESSP